MLSTVLFGGWILMAPPVAQKHTLMTPPVIRNPNPAGVPTLNDTAPMTQWKSEKSFDSARQCESYGVSFKAFGKEWQSKCESDNSAKMGQQAGAYCELTIRSASLARCVPAEGYGIDDQALIDTWTHVSAHDTAAKCEEARGKAVDDGRDLIVDEEMKKSAPASEPAKQKEKRLFDAFKQADAVKDTDPRLSYPRSFRCIPAEHIYPPKKP
jgi:hypothetical protein